MGGGGGRAEHMHGCNGVVNATGGRALVNARRAVCLCSYGHHKAGGWAAQRTSVWAQVWRLHDMRTPGCRRACAPLHRPCAARGPALRTALLVSPRAPDGVDLIKEDDGRLLAAGQPENLPHLGRGGCRPGDSAGHARQAGRDCSARPGGFRAGRPRFASNKARPPSPAPTLMNNPGPVWVLAAAASQRRWPSTERTGHALEGGAGPHQARTLPDVALHQLAADHADEGRSAAVGHGARGQRLAWGFGRTGGQLTTTLWVGI